MGGRRRLGGSSLGFGQGISSGETQFLLWEVPVDLLKTFLENYQVHRDHIDLDRESLLGYIDRKIAQDEQKMQTWSVVIVSNSRDSAVEVNFRGIGDLNLVNRSRFQTLHEETIDIKALVSRNDYTLDMHRSWRLETTLGMMFTACGERMLISRFLLLYPINKDSPAPRQENTGSHSPREELGTCHHVLGVGIMFPDISPTSSEAQTYVFADIPTEDFTDEYPEVPGRMRDEDCS